MPAATPWAFRVTSIEKGEILALARPDRAHDTALDAGDGGFAEAVLDIALALVTISVFDDVTKAIAARPEIAVRHIAPVLVTSGELRIRATVVEYDDDAVVAEASLEDRYGMEYARARSITSE